MVQNDDVQLTWLRIVHSRDGGTAAAAPLPFRPGNTALCGSCPL